MTSSKPTKQAIRERVVTILVNQLNVRAEDIKDESELYDDLGADSLDAVELLLAIEDEFKELVEKDSLNEAEAAQMTTVGAIVDFIAAKDFIEQIAPSEKKLRSALKTAIQMWQDEADHCRTAASQSARAHRYDQATEFAIQASTKDSVAATLRLILQENQTEVKSS